MKPKLSILLPAFRGYDSILPALRTWESQTCRDQLEILVLCPTNLGPSAQQASAVPASQIIVPVGSADLHEARAIGVQQATADYVMLAEDHCVPDPDWAEAILARIQEGWDAIGPALRPGNLSTCWAASSFLIGYGEWMSPVEGGPTSVLCGWNGTIRTQLLRDIGPQLSQELTLGAFVVRRLHQQGAKFYLESRARMRHFDPSGWSYEIFLLLLVGLGFGSMRTRHWPLPARLLYPFAAPAVAFLHARRAFKHYRRAGRQAGLNPLSLAASFILASAWALGEALGSWLGTARVTPVLWRTEVKPVTDEAIGRSDAHEQTALSEPTRAWAG